MEEAGAFCIVFECLPRELAKKLTAALEIPTIGIGAGPDTDGQVQVNADLIGFFTNYLPKHAKCYANLGEQMIRALKDYADDVRSGKFPEDSNSFD